ncbi:N-acetylmuramoyl-L-alanine amidase CwlD [Aceticella autotrophica]|uniref:N-acetylmuramoyl-L-alanine amidase CwlD n=1 Tax=Aceticella autotrophica TaxID=2755338 RepID=A0A975AVK3_9THEO|nr:N-acetylmuramoyl-L-alanine amidase CwlD [Aceticella autotrophica]QSZ27239.1 N-acetylmuramoyl-L-alanine amidase CwlD [Aceticella autotrophica]
MKVNKYILIAFLFFCTSLVYSCLNKSIEIFNKLPISNKIIIIDAGHGGGDPGKPGKYGKNEDELNLEIATKLKELIEESGGVAVMTRQGDPLSDNLMQDLKNRVKKGNNANGEVFISIHQNSFPQEQYKGAQVFYHKNSEKGKFLAEILQKELKNTLDESNDRMPKETSTFYILRNAKMPAVIVECGFMSNPEEEKLLNDKKYQYKIAWAIYKGLMRYFNEIS